MNGDLLNSKPDDEKSEVNTEERTDASTTGFEACSAEADLPEREALPDREAPASDKSEYLPGDVKIDTLTARVQKVSSADIGTSAPSRENSYGGFKNKWSYEEYERARSTKRAKSSSRGLKAFAITMTMLAIVSITCLAIVLAGGFEALGVGEGKTGSNTPVISIPTAQVSDGELSNKQIIKKAKPSVVGIMCDIMNNGKLVSQSIGSGFIITEDGYIVTNNHVVSDASKISVLCSDGTEYEAKLIGGDSLTDVAVIKIDAKGLPAVEMGNSDYLEEGDPVIAIGTPAGIEFAGTCTHGMVSAINRDVKIYDTTGVFVKSMTVIQTDASINPGNSGGPLLNSQAQVVGITTLKISNGYEGMGFALPINGVIPIVNELITNGKVIDRPSDSFASGRAVLGVTIEAVTEDDMNNYGIPAGCFVRNVTKDGAAYNAGIKRGDIITECNGKAITANTDLTDILSDLKPGDEIKLKIYRDDYFEVTVVLGSE